MSTSPSDLAAAVASGATLKDTVVFSSGRIASPANGVVLEFVAPYALKFDQIQANAGNWGTAAGPSVITATLDGAAFDPVIAPSFPETLTDDATSPASGNQADIPAGSKVTLTLSGAATGLADLVVQAVCRSATLV